MSMFQQLFRIREIREQRAQAAMQAERTALRRATEAREDASQALDRYRAWAKTREDTLFSELMENPVQVRDIQEVRHEVGAMRSKELGYAQDLEKFEAARSRQSEVLDAARERHAIAERTRQKVEERLVIDRRETAASRDRAEESDMEEVTSAGGPAQDAADLQGVSHG